MIYFVDVGTHYGQEYNALFDNSLYKLFWKYIRRKIGALCGIGSKETVSLSDLFCLNRLSSDLVSRRDEIFYICVEPNSRLYRRSVYQQADLVVSSAISDISGKDSLAFTKLFFSDKGDESQAASVFEQNSQINAQKHRTVLNISPKMFATVLKTIIDVNDKVILRINNEGAEDDVIYALHSVFNDRLSLVMGSLKDVGVVKGRHAADKLETFMMCHNIRYIEFHSSILTWRNAMRAVKQMLVEAQDSD